MASQFHKLSLLSQNQRIAPCAIRSFQTISSSKLLVGSVKSFVENERNR